MQEDLRYLIHWLGVNGLKLNVGKTKALLFNAEGLTPNIDLEIYGQKIQTVTDFKFLRMHLDASLSFVKQFTELHKCLSQAVFIIRKLLKILPSDCLRTLYYAYFHSNLTYRLAVWYPLLSKSTQNTLYIMQKRVVCSILGASFRQHCMLLFKRLHTGRARLIRTRLI